MHKQDLQIADLKARYLNFSVQLFYYIKWITSRLFQYHKGTRGLQTGTIISCRVKQTLAPARFMLEVGSLLIHQISDVRRLLEVRNAGRNYHKLLVMRRDGEDPDQHSFEIVGTILGAFNLVSARY